MTVRVLLRMLKVVLVTIVALVLVVVVAGVILVRRPFPQVEGTVRLPGLDGKVEIYRDEWGIPHIYAETDHDLFFAQGYVHAQDRLWQLEFNRRIAPGRLSEVLGEAALADDRYLRTLGMGRAAQAEADELDAESRAALEAYAAGINAYVAEGRALPIEFTILGFEPEPWTPADSIGWGKVIAWDLATNRDQELFRVDLMARVGEEQMWALTPPYPANAPLSIAREVEYGSLSTRLLPQGGLRGKWLAPSGRGLGSNTWVVGGSRSTTGRPLLANDPHLGIQMPSIWYEIGLHCRELNERCRYEAVGSSFPGAPAVVIGHNPWIAWGMAAPLNDVQDWYVEKVNPDNPHQVEYQGRWEDVHVIREEIRVKGWEEPDVVEVRVTRHGPIMSDVMDDAGQVLALRWRALEPSTLMPAVLSVGRARDWDEFRAALSQWTIAGMNFVYADVEGNIGFQVTGEIPIRAAGDGLLPAPGWTGDHEWIGSVPFDEMPSSL
ncbi:MAG TPA: penicillin acylase family protein, partial [Anaerolineae bacterium]|nr:penicillin acylase family protein [Anaerolineae bacterium]